METQELKTFDGTLVQDVSNDKLEYKVSHNNFQGQIFSSVVRFEGDFTTFIDCTFHDCTLNLKLHRCEFHNCNFRHSKIIGTIEYCNFYGGEIHYTKIIDSQFQHNVMTNRLTNVDFTGSDLTGNYFADLVRGMNISQTKGLDNGSDLMNQFEKTDKGWIVYKAIGGTTYPIPNEWQILPGSLLTEQVNHNRFEDCGCGVNFGTLDFIKRNYRNCQQLWKCLLQYEDAYDVCIPYNTDGKARCGKLKLLEKIAPPWRS